jgi:Transposase
MVVLGIDAHERSHTVIAVDEHGRELGERTVGTTTADHLDLLVWASRFDAERRWAVEDCRHLSRRLERDLLGAGQQVARVPVEWQREPTTPPRVLTIVGAARPARPTARRGWRDVDADGHRPRAIGQPLVSDGSGS